MTMQVASLAGKIKTELEVEFGPALRADWLTKFSNAMARAILDEIQNQATIVLQASDIAVNPGSFLDSLGQPVTGQGQNAAGTINEGRIQ